MNLSVNHHRPRSATTSVAVFLHGFASDQTGEKAEFLRERLLGEGLAYVTFDFRGHGKSEGSMRDLTLSGLIEDCRQVISPLASEYKKVVLVGSSMGACAAAWYSVLAAGQVTACAFIAPAFNFVNLIVNQIGPGRLKEWKREGTLKFTNQYCGVELGYDLVRDWTKYSLASLTSKYSTPSMIVHGLRDDAVSYLHSLSFAARASKAEIDVILVGNGDHRLTAHKERLGDWIAPALRRWCGA